LLELKRLSAGYGELEVVRSLDLEVSEGEIVALLGPNGSGKTTTLLTISGLLPSLGGEIEVLGRAPSASQPWKVSRLGLAHVPEDRALFPGLTVAENLRLALPRGRKGFDLATEYFPALGPLMSRKAGLLSGGEQQMLALARALVSEPRLILVDEMSAGLAPVIVQRLLPTLRRIADDTGAGIVLVEQHIELALAFADRGYVMVHGQVVEQGKASDLATRIDVLEARYFGEAAIVEARRSSG
jgi:branched-chain amino acid transport system ATP-binding protein